MWYECKVVLHHQSLVEPAVITKLASLLNKSTGEVIKQNPRALTKGVTAVVDLRLQRAICVEEFKNDKELGRFLLRSGGKTLAAGNVISG